MSLRQRPTTTQPELNLCHKPEVRRSSEPETPRWVWMLLMLLVAALVAGTAGLLAKAGGATVPNAILTGGAAFAGAVGLLLGLAHFLTGGQK